MQQQHSGSTEQKNVPHHKTHGTSKKEMKKFHHPEESKIPFKVLHDDNKIPMMGLGTLNLSENECTNVIKRSILDFGYRLIDTSPVYGNEKAVGKALKECMDAGVKREELFVISKLWITDRNNVEDALRQSLNNLGLEYVDLYLIHYVIPDIVKDTLMVERVSI